jgi:hypothetical protein
LSVCVFLFMWSTHSLLYIASSSSLHCLGGFGFSFRGWILNAFQPGMEWEYIVT